MSDFHASNPFAEMSPALAYVNLPFLNKGTAFTADERARLGLDGLLPSVIETLDEQAARAHEAYSAYETDLAKHVYLRALQDTNQILFYRLLLDHVAEMLPIVYTPTVGPACQRFSHIYRRGRGMFISYALRGRIREVLRNRPMRDVNVIVVTDGERILGLGDQGVGGLGISIGKLTLYSLIGGVPPARTLPMVLDVGTNNAERLADPEYLGWRHERIGGDEYYNFVDEFVEAVKAELPDTCLQWEDFATTHARPLLDRYRDQLLTFNDDIQGTAAVALGTMLGAIGVTGKPLREQEFVFLGGGSASIGVADYLVTAMVEDGLSKADALSRVWIVDINGLLTDRREGLTAEQQVYAKPTERVSGWKAGSMITLADVIENVTATALIGLSTAKGAFTEAIVRKMASKVDRPIIFPLSNPTDHAEATPQDLMDWTEGRALIATGSPFAPATVGRRTIPIAQCNNVFIFPAVGLALAASGAKRVTDSMLVAAARELGRHSPVINDPDGSLLPHVGDLRTIAVDIATAVAAEAQRAGLASELAGDPREAVAAKQWVPQYVEDLGHRT